jgi:hypothetical protein
MYILQRVVEPPVYLLHVTLLYLRRKRRTGNVSRLVGGSLGTPVSSITKTGRYDIAEILLKVVLNTKNQIIM